MKTLALLLFSTMAFSQATFTFYTGTSKSFGAEVMFSEHLGFGFAGTNQGNIGLGEEKKGNVNDWDMKYSLNSKNKTFYANYAVFSFGYFEGVKLNYTLGTAWYQRIRNFNYNGYLYNKVESTYIKPIVGIDFSKEITKDIGVKIGYDTFNEIKIGICVYF